MTTDFSKTSRLPESLGVEEKSKKRVAFRLLDPVSNLNKSETVSTATRRSAIQETPLEKSIVNLLDGEEGSIERLAFERDPSNYSSWASVYEPKHTLIPNKLLKRISIQDSLVAAICKARSSHVSAFGHAQEDRFSTGFRIVPRAGVMERASDKQKEALQQRINRALEQIENCGNPTGWSSDEKMNFSQFLEMSVRDGVVVGSMATEVIWAEEMSGNKVFHSFRPVDAGTIYRAVKQKTAVQQVRNQAYHLLKQIKGDTGDKLIPEKFINDEYAYVQVIDGKPVQAFTSDEMIVTNLYPVTDVDLNGYPLTPIDTVIADITTHINITTHNKLYFQNGRATRGMLVIRSDDADEGVVQSITQQFNASINNVNNSWRMPVFGVGPEDDVTWQAFDAGQRDMEFQYLSDQNARVILSAFQMSPEELPGYAHLCLHPETRVWTKKGFQPIKEILGDSDYASDFKVWTGTKWENARAFITGSRKVSRTKTTNGIEIVSSPDHLFRVVDSSGNLAWRKQEDLAVGDHILVNREPAPGSEESIPVYNGKKLTPDMMEVLGWLTGDGTIAVRSRGKKKKSKELEFYYHHEKETKIRDRHFEIMSQWGLNPLLRDRRISSRAAEKQKELYGFESIASVRLLINLYDSDFVRWLLGIGFTSSREGKTIPSFIHALPVEYRSAFLRGLFSADGSRSKSNTPSITVSDDKLRDQTKLLLLSMGLRTRACEGTVKTVFEKSEDSYKQGRVKGSNQLIVKDKKLFFERIGFLQDHKQPTSALSKAYERWDKLPRSVALWLYERILETEEGQRDRDSVRHILKDPIYDNQVRSKIFDLADKYGIQMPEWISRYFFEQVAGLVLEDVEVEMVDIEVFDSEHAFMAEGVLVHNSRGTNNQALCLAKSSVITTTSGALTLEQILADQDSVDIEVWTGTEFAKARVFLSGEKKLSLTYIGNGSVVESSPDHRFRVIGEDGLPAWKRQEDLVVGDTVLVNRKPVEGVGRIPEYNSKPVTPEIMEALGWLIGDGNFHIRCNKNTGNIKQIAMTWFYNATKEPEIWERHLRILTDFGLTPKEHNKTLPEEEKEDLKQRYGFNKVASKRLKISLYDTAFGKWLLDLGFQSSTEGKVIPSFVHTLPVEYRTAFLRGLFSADGSRGKNSLATRIVIHDDRLRKQTRDLLLGLGIRTQRHEGLKKQEINGTARRMVEGSSTLSIKDKDIFYELIGFLQPYKVPEQKLLGNSDKKWRKLPAKLVQHLFGEVPSSGNYDRKKHPNARRAALNGCSLSYVERFMEDHGREIPSWVYDYHFEEVVELEVTNEVIEMADVEVFNNEHAFVAQGVIVHNSESNNEYKLNAARDVGIRPLLSKIQDFINDRILPLIDEELSKLCVFQLAGIDADTPEKETAFIQQAAMLHMTYSEILEKVEKESIPTEYGGKFPLNPQFQAVIEKYLTFGEILEYFFKKEGASQKEDLKFYQNPIWMQWVQLQLQMKQIEQQEQMLQQQAQMEEQEAALQAAGGAQEAPPEESPPPAASSEQSANAAASSSGEGDLATGVDQLLTMLSKSENKNLPPNKKKLIVQHTATTKKIMDKFEKESQELLAEVAKLAIQNKKTKKKK